MAVPGYTALLINNERVRAALTRIDEMSDIELRQLVRGEPPIVVEAGEGIIARRQSREQPGEPQGRLTDTGAAQAVVERACGCSAS